MVNVWKILKGISGLCMVIILFPFRMVMAGFKTFTEYGKVKQKLNLRKGRVLFFKGNRMMDKMLDFKDDLFAADVFEQLLFFKNKNTYLDEPGNSLMVATDGNPEAQDLSKYKCDKEVQESKATIENDGNKFVININDSTKPVEIKHDELKAKTKHDITFRKIIYTPVDIHEKDTGEKKEASNLFMKVFSSKVIEVIRPAAGAEILYATAMGIALGFILAMTTAYYLK